MMIYPTLSDSLILPVTDDIYIYASYNKQSYEAYKKEGDKYILVGQLGYGALEGNPDEQEIFFKWLREVGYF